VHQEGMKALCHLQTDGTATVPSRPGEIFGWKHNWL